MPDDLINDPALSTDADYLSDLERVKEIAQSILKPNATNADLADKPLESNYLALAQAGFLGIQVPKEYGGMATTPLFQREYTEILSAACGVTTFVQAQHHGPTSMIVAHGQNELKDFVVPRLATGTSQAGVSFAHLRRPGTPILRVEKIVSGYRLNGRAPWVTGWGLIDQFVVAGITPEDKHAYLWVPAEKDKFPLFSSKELSNSGNDEMLISAPLKLCAMNASSTVEITFQNYFVPERHFLFHSDSPTLARNDRNGVLGASALTLGCARGAIELLQRVASSRSISVATALAAELAEERAELRKHIYSVTSASDEESYHQALNYRAHSIELASRSALAAIAATSGQANLATNPAQRYLREAMFYSIQAQTKSVLEQTLKRFSRR